MINKGKYLQKSNFYSILDTKYCSSANIPKITKILLKGGADIIQLRAKDLEKDEISKIGKGMLTQCRENGVPFIINDYVDVANEIDADGVHLGIDDMSISDARDILGKEKIIGRSSHSIEQAREGFESETDYFAFGPLFKTETKPDYEEVGLEEIKEVKKIAKEKPVFFIGGINKHRLRRVINAGVDRLVIVSDLLLDDKPAEYISDVKNMLNKA